MKLAILADSHLSFDKNINGTLVQLDFLSNEFAKNGIDVYYICRNEIDNPEEVNKNLKFKLINYPNNIFTPFYQKKLYYETLIKIKPDCIYVRGRSIFQYVAIKYQKNYKINYIWHTNGKDGVLLWKNTNKLISSNKNVLKKLILAIPFILHDIYINIGIKNSRNIINQTKDQKILTKNLLDVDGTIIPNFFPKLSHIPKKSNSIIWLANLSKNKSPETFIKIINRMQSNKWSSILAGGTKNKDYQKKIANSCKKSNIDFLGRVSFKYSTDLIANSRIYINTSDPNSDGLSNAFIQSWLAGTIVLSLNHDPNGWMKKHKIGFYANGNIERLIDSLNFLINNEKILQEMSRKAKTFAEKTFSGNKLVKKYLNMIDINLCG